MTSQTTSDPEPTSAEFASGNIVALTDPRGTDVSRFGGKGAGLAKLVGAGLPVPDGFLIASGALEHMAARLQSTLAKEPGISSEESTGTNEAETLLLRQTTAYLEHLGIVAVRSSALNEDGPQHAAAGQYTTVLGVQAIHYREAVEKVVASQYVDHVAQYWGETATRNQIAVVTQRLVASRTSGVLFTRDPVTGEATNVIEACLGLGVSVVDGDGVLERSYVEPRTLALISQRLRTHGAQRRWDPAQGRVVTERIEKRERVPVLTRRERALLVEAGHIIEDLLTSPADIEWTFEGDDLLILQARPITTLGAR